MPDTSTKRGAPFTLSANQIPTLLAKIWSKFDFGIHEHLVGVKSGPMFKRRTCR